MVTAFLRLEGVVILAASVALYAAWGFSWPLFALLLLVPDISMVGYLKDRWLGALAYNVGHSYLLPAALATFGLLRDAPAAVAVAVIWFAHIGMDRALGFGLKRSTGFHDTHLGHVGKPLPPPHATRVMFL